MTFELKLDLGDAELIGAVARAEALAQIVRGIPMPPAVYEKIDRLNILRAVRGTTGIEGADLSEEEVGRVLSTSGHVLGQSRVREEREVRNAANVMAFVADTPQDRPTRPLTEPLICEIHRLTTEGIDYPGNTPGSFRAHAVHALDYVPPRSAAEVRRLMREFVTWLNEGPAIFWPPVVRAIAAHFYFVSIHPFGDGNGRTARAIESYLLYQAGINVVGFYSLSNFYYRNRHAYVEMLDHTRFRSQGNLTPLVKFALNGLVEELEQVRDEVLAALTRIVFFDYARETLALAKKDRAPAGDRMVHLLEHVLEPASVADIKAGRHVLALLYRNISSKTLDRDLRFLEDHRLITRHQGRHPGEPGGYAAVHPLVDGMRLLKPKRLRYSVGQAFSLAG